MAEHRLSSFYSGLKELMDKSPKEQNGQRPFVCDGNPFDCKIFLVGHNPVTSISGHAFDYYWKDGFGFDKELWWQEYLKEKKREGKPITKTRKYLQAIEEAARPHVCMETDIYSTPSSYLKDLPGRERNTDIFDYVFATIKPRVLFVHGRKAVQHLEDQWDRPLTIGEFQEIRIGSSAMWVYAARHLAAAGWSRTRAQDIGSQLHNRCSAE